MGPALTAVILIAAASALRRQALFEEDAQAIRAREKPGMLVVIWGLLLSTGV